MHRRHSTTVLAVAVLMAFLGSGAKAQLRVELGATIGRYSPLGSFANEQAYSVKLPSDPSELSGAAIGGLLRIWPAGKFGIQLAGFTAASEVGGGNTPEGYFSPVRARVSTATAEVLYLVTGEDHRARIWFDAGPAAVWHGGPAYKVFDNPMNYGGVGGIGSSIRLAGPLDAELGVSVIAYRMTARTVVAGAEAGERGSQLDAQFRTGLSYRWH